MRQVSLALLQLFLPCPLFPLALLASALCLCLLHLLSLEAACLKCTSALLVQTHCLKPLSGERSLAKKKVAEKKVAITVFSFPPDKGNVGTAAYLNVFGSIYRVLQDLKAQGYTIEDVPEKEEDLIKMVNPLEHS